MNGKALAITLGSLILVLVATLGVLLYIKNQPKQTALPTQTPDQTQTTPIAAQNVVLTPKLVTAGNRQAIELWINSVPAQQPVSTLALKATFSSNPQDSLQSTSSKPQMGDRFIGSEWANPFSEVVTNEDGTITLNVSAIYLSIEPFYLTENPVLFATIPVDAENVTSLTMLVDNQVTELYDKQANKLGIVNAGLAQQVSME